MHEVPPRKDYGVVAFGELMSKVIRSLLENFTLTLLVQTHGLSILGSGVRVTPGALVRRDH